MNNKLKRLISLLNKMDLPVYRKSHMTKSNLQWLAKNLQVRNADSKYYDEASGLINMILNEKLYDQ